MKKAITYPITKVKQVELQNLKPVAALRLKKQKPVAAPRKFLKKQTPKVNFMRELSNNYLDDAKKLGFSWKDLLNEDTRQKVIIAITNYRIKKDYKKNYF